MLKHDHFGSIVCRPANHTAGIVRVLFYVEVLNSFDTSYYYVFSI